MEQSTQHNISLLFVEDNETIRFLYNRLLSKRVKDFYIAEDGQKALDMAIANDYKLILMDMHMPVMDGIEATLKIRQLPRGRHIPIIAMTANAFTEDKERCMEAGMNDFVTKPVSPPILYEKIARLLQKSSNGWCGAKATDDSVV